MDPRNQGTGMEQGGENAGKFPENRGQGIGPTVTTDTVGDFFKTSPSANGKAVAHQLQLATTDFGKEILNQIPNSRERSLALQKLQECWFFLNQAVINYL